MDLETLVRALRDPGAYPHQVAGDIDVVSTHISVVLLAGDRVYKIKKPVHPAFLDYSTLERRRHFCGEEVRLNRRLAPEVYLGVAPIIAGGGAVRIGAPGDPGDGAVEYAVVMRRLPAAGMLEARLGRGDVDRAMMRRIAGALVRFHEDAATGPGVDEHGAPDAVVAAIGRNLDDLAEHGAAIDAALLDGLRRRLRTMAEAARPRIADRVAAGRVRDGHGDLHAGNICAPDPATIVIYDCVEFSAALRCADVASEIAFLAMDLDAHGRRDLAGALVRRYVRGAGDAELAALLPMYRAHRAAIRTKVHAYGAAAEADDDDARARELERAARYLETAAAATVEPALVLTCGGPGSGKSWAADRIAAPLFAPVLRSDVVRKTLAGLAPTRRGDASIYTRAFSDRTYAALRERAARALRRGRSVVVDATFRTTARRGPFIALARELGRPVAIAHLDPPADVVARRLARRAGDASAISDAGADVAARLAAELEAPAASEGAPVARFTGGPQAARLRADILVALTRA